MTDDDSVMLNPEQQRLVLKAIAKGPRPLATLRVWSAVILHIRRDTGEITEGGHELAEDAGVTADETYRALTRLTKIGALLMLEPGRYAINPHVGWVGDLAKRQEAAKDVPPVRPVEP
jgi:hypothetical protein